MCAQNMNVLIMLVWRIVVLALFYELLACRKHHANPGKSANKDIPEPVLDYGEDEPHQPSDDIINKLADMPLLDQLLGSMNDKDKIVGGTPTKVSRWPWMAGLVRKGKTSPFCGGSLIDSNTIVTAGHCVSRERPNNLRVVLGTTRLGARGRDATAQTFEVRSVRVHPNYKFPMNDIAIIKLKTDVQPNANIRPIDLDDGQASGTGRSAAVAGWGSTKYGGQMSRRLRDVTLKLWDNNSCDKAIKDFRITAGMVCAGDAKGRSKDACQGDSGGPLMSRASGRWKLIGVVSFGDECGKPNTPGVYTRVNKYRDWVMQQAKY